MQHNVQAAIFHLAQYSMCSSRRRCQRVCVRACGVFFTPAVSPSNSHVIAVHNNIRYARQHGVRSARQFHSRRRQRRLLRSQRQQMAALNFVNFFFVK